MAVHNHRFGSHTFHEHCVGAYRLLQCVTNVPCIPPSLTGQVCHAALGVYPVPLLPAEHVTKRLKDISGAYRGEQSCSQWHQKLADYTRDSCPSRLRTTAAKYAAAAFETDPSCLKSQFKSINPGSAHFDTALAVLQSDQFQQVAESWIAPGAVTSGTTNYTEAVTAARCGDPDADLGLDDSLQKPTAQAHELSTLPQPELLQLDARVQLQHDPWVSTHTTEWMEMTRLQMSCLSNMQLLKEKNVPRGRRHVVAESEEKLQILQGRGVSVAKDVMDAHQPARSPCDAPSDRQGGAGMGARQGDSVDNGGARRPSQLGHNSVGHQDVSEGALQASLGVSCGYGQMITSDEVHAQVARQMEVSSAVAEVAAPFWRCTCAPPLPDRPCGMCRSPCGRVRTTQQK